jgi:hypothetical protein
MEFRALMMSFLNGLLRIRVVRVLWLKKNTENAVETLMVKMKIA